MPEYTIEEKWEYQKDQIVKNGICPSCGNSNHLKVELIYKYIEPSGQFTSPKRERKLNGNCTVICEFGAELCRCCNGEGIVECENGCCEYDCKRCDGEGREDDLCLEWAGEVGEAVKKFIPEPVEMRNYAP